MEQTSIRTEITLLVNGTKRIVSGEAAFFPLAQYLRTEAHLPGTKIVCAEGDCGACTVLVARWKDTTWDEFETLNSCIAPVYLFDLASIVTVEGLAQNGELNEVQRKMREHHGGQCGFCTPGMVCSISGLAEKCQQKSKAIEPKMVRNHLTGNLCRCTGYEPIIDAAVNVNLKEWIPLSERFLTPEHKETFKNLAAFSIEIQNQKRQVFIPKKLEAAIEIKKQTPEVRIVAGATDLGVLHNKGKSFLDQVLIVQNIPEMQRLENTNQGLWVGAKTSLSKFENFCAENFPEFSRLLRIFASPQIKNQGTLLGNVLNGSPIGDSLPPLLVLEAEIHLASSRGVRKVPLNSFYKAYKKFDIQPDEIATGLLIPFLDESWKTKFYKVSMRKDLDISAVTFAGAFQMKDRKIIAARVALGGVGPTVFRLHDVEKIFIDKYFDEKVFAEAGQLANSLIKPLSDLRASEQYRRKVTENLFHKCFVDLSSEVSPCP